MQVILNVTYSLPKHPRLICFYIINIVFLEDNIVMQFLNQDEKKHWGKQTANAATVSLEETLHKISRPDHVKCKAVVYTQGLRTKIWQW